MSAEEAKIETDKDYCKGYEDGMKKGKEYAKILVKKEIQLLRDKIEAKDKEFADWCKKYQCDAYDEVEHIENKYKMIVEILDTYINTPVKKDI